MHAHEIKDTIIRHYVKKRMAVNTEVGLATYAICAEVGVCKWGRFRADLMALSMRGEVTIIEVKSSVRDFRTDKKWRNYLQFSNRFYFAVDESTWTKIQDDIPKEVGVIVVQEWEVNGRRRVKPRVVRPSRRREIEASVHQNLIIRLAFRVAEFNSYKRN